MTSSPTRRVLRVYAPVRLHCLSKKSCSTFKMNDPCQERTFIPTVRENYALTDFLPCLSGQMMHSREILSVFATNKHIGAKEVVIFLRFMENARRRIFIRRRMIRPALRSSSVSAVVLPRVVRQIIKTCYARPVPPPGWFSGLLTYIKLQAVLVYLTGISTRP